MAIAPFAAGKLVSPGIKKILLSVFFMLIICTNVFSHPVVVVSKSRPILINGGFENNLAGWSTITNNGSKATFTITNDALHVHSGLQGMIVNVIIPVLLKIP